MRIFGLIFLLMFCCEFSFSQKQYNVMDWKTDVTLNSFLIQEMKSIYALRKTDLTKTLQSKTKTIEYIRDVRSKFKLLVGDMPALSSLNAKVTGTIKRDGYVIEKIIYESFADHHVTSNLYIPEGKGPFPAALLFCGHENEAKATESYQKTAILFAKNGFVVLVVDPVSQGERMQLTDKNGKPLF